jgi:hypothetical protein
MGTCYFLAQRRTKQGGLRGSIHRIEFFPQTGAASTEKEDVAITVSRPAYIGAGVFRPSQVDKSIEARENSIGKRRFRNLNTQ